MGVSQYLGRTVDILAYQGATPVGEVMLSQNLIGDGNSGQVCTGIQKLAQRFLLELLTEKGTLAYQPDRGCEFLTEARYGYFRTSTDVLLSFSASLVDITNNLLSDETDDDPDDEKFDSAEILSVLLFAGSAAIKVKINSVAGDSRVAILPLNTLV